MSNPVLVLKADTIVAREKNGLVTFTCFKYTEGSYADALAFHRAQHDRVEIELQDGNGDFTSPRRYFLLEVDVPNRGNTLGGRDNVLIVEAELV